MIIKSKKFLSNSVKSGQKSRAIAEIYVDTASELPAYDSNPDFEFLQGSIAYVVKSGKFYVMGSDNQWYDTDGNLAEVI